MKQRKTTFLAAMVMLSVAALLGAAVPCTAAVVYVAPASDPARAVQDGTSWANAYSSLGEAIQSTVSGDEIWVVAGAYSTADWGCYFELPAGVGLYGGFSGVETMRCQRDWVSNTCLITGMGGGGNILVVQDGCVVDGFTFSGEDEGVYCWGNATVAHNNFDSSIYCFGVHVETGSPLITGNTFVGCYTGVFCENAAARISNNLIRSCGNGVFVQCGDVSHIINNTIVDNGFGVVANGWGMFTQPTIANNIFYGTVEAAIQASNNAAATLSHNCMFCNGMDYEGVTPDQWSFNSNPILDMGTYYPLANSPCLDAGSDGYLLQDETDLGGCVRLYNDHVDIGCHEYQ